MPLDYFGPVPGTDRPPRIAVVGDIMIDVSVIAADRGASPESPEMRRYSALWKRSEAGGAANTAVNLWRMGAVVCLSGVVSSSQMLPPRPPAPDARFRCLAISVPGRPDTIKTRVLDDADGRMVFRLDSETTKPIEDLVADRIVDRLAEQGPYDAVVVSDYGKGVVTPRLLSELSQLPGTWDRRTPVLVDPKGSDLLRYGRVFLIKPNEAESASAVRNGDYPAFASEWLLETRGADGCVLVGGDLSQRRQSGFRRRGNPNGCGDSFLAALAYGVACRRDPAECLRVACAAGAAAVGRTERGLLKAVGSADVAAILAAAGEVSEAA